MDNLTICKKIAEINGDNVTLQIPESCECYLYDEANECEYDPLTDDALCFRLMVKHKVNMSWLWDELDGTPHYQAFINEDSSDMKYSKSPNKAICLTIIKAHK